MSGDERDREGEKETVFLLNLFSSLYSLPVPQLGPKASVSNLHIE